MSYIRKALEAAEKKKLGVPLAPPRPTAAASEPVTWQGWLKNIALAALESATMERNKILPAVDDRAAISAYKILRTRVLQRMRTNNWRSVIVTGAGPGEGKSLTASNLAIGMAHDVNQSVILVDLDLQRPMLANYFGLDIQAGIGDYLAGKATIEEILYRPEGLERMLIIPNREAVPNSSELLTSPRMRELVEWTKATGDRTVTVFDMPPVLISDDVLAFAPAVDCIMLVVSEGKTERASLARTMEILGERNFVGVVLNQSRERESTSPYYY